MNKNKSSFLKNGSKVERKKKITNYSGTFNIISLVVASCLPSIFSLYGDFVFDDSEAVVNNKDVSSESWLDCFAHDFWGTPIRSNLSHKSYRPLTVISFKLNYVFSNYQLNASHFKITNLFLHIICCMLVWKTYEVLLRTSIRRRNKKGQSNIALIAAVIFAIHPVHAEAVNGVVGRADVLAGVAYFSAFLFYDKSITSKSMNYLYLSATILLAGMGMLFKENGVTVLAFCLVHEFLILNMKTNKTLIPKQQSMIRFGCIVISVIFFLYGRWTVMGGTKPEFKAIDNPAALANDHYTKIATHNYIYFLNLLLLIWPQWLCYDWSMGCVPLITSTLDFRLIFVILTYAYGILFIRTLFNKKIKKKYKRLLIATTSLAVIPFLPAMNIFYPVGFVIAERVLYIPSAGYCLLITLGFFRILRKYSKKLCITGLLFLIFVYSAKSWERAKQWQSEHTLFLSAFPVCPLNAKVLYNAAKIFDSNKQYELAVATYKESIRLNPEYYQAMNNLANLLKNRKEFEEAEFYLRTAINIKHDFPAAWMNLGIVLAQIKSYEESKKAYETALSYRKNYPDCHFNLGNLYLEMNNTKGAENSWWRAIELNSTHVLAWANLLFLMDNTGQIHKALQLIPEALSNLPEAPTVKFAAANIYGKLGSYVQAEKLFVEALILFGPRAKGIHFYNLGVLYHRWKKYDFAKKAYKKTLKIDPTYSSAKKQLLSLENMKS